MTDIDILKPVVVLIIWSIVMLAWLVAVRLPAMKKAGIDLRTVSGGKPGALDGVVPDRAQWPAHNYIHLMEQPTLFYAVCLVLVAVDRGGGLNAEVAWGYVVLRILHSLVQATFNRIAIRFALFGLSTACLIVLAHNAAFAVWHRG